MEYYAAIKNDVVYTWHKHTYNILYEVNYETV